MRDLQRHAHGGRSRHRLGGRHDRHPQAKAGTASSCRSSSRSATARAWAAQRGQVALFVTERAVFRVGPNGLELIEIAPGLDVERDVIAHMGFRPVVSSDAEADGSAHLRRGADGARRRHPREAARVSIAARRALARPTQLSSMAHVPAERCLGIIELLGDGASEMPLGEIAERLALPKSGAHRLLATLVDLGWAEQDRGTGFYRLTMRLAVLGQRFYAASGVPDICQPLIDRLARECSEFVRLAVVDGNALVWIAHAQGARGGLVYQPAETTGTRAALCDGQRQGMARDTAQRGRNALRPEERRLRSRRPVRSERDSIDRGAVARSQDDRPARLWTGAQRSGARRHRGGCGRAIGARRRRRRHGQHRGPAARVDESRVRELAPMVMQCATELSNVWPLRSETVTKRAVKDAVKAA